VRFSNAFNLERIGNEICIEQLKDVISDTHLFNTTGSPNQIIPETLYDLIRLLVNDLGPKSIFDSCLMRDSYPIIENFKNFKGILRHL